MDFPAQSYISRRDRLYPCGAILRELNVRLRGHAARLHAQVLGSLDDRQLAVDLAIAGAFALPLVDEGADLCGADY